MSSIRLKLQLTFISRVLISFYLPEGEQTANNLELQLEKLQLKTLLPDNSEKINSNFNCNTVQAQQIHPCM